MNENIDTVIIAPMTTKLHKYPTRVKISLNGTEGWIVLDQIRAIDKRRIINKIGKSNSKNSGEVKKVINEMLVE